MNIQIARRDEAPLRRETEFVPGNTFLRIITARALGELQGETPARIAAERWPADKAVSQWLMRSASTPAMVSVAGWAAELSQKIVIDALAAMGAAAAGPKVLSQSTVLNFDGHGIISAPGFVASAANAAFVAEGAPIPVRQLAVAPAQMQPYKLGAISVLSEEMIASSNAETLIGDTLIRSAANALDAALFDTNAATAARPAGLRSGIGALTASTVTSPWDAYFADATTLVNAISPIAGDGPYLLITSPGRAVNMQLRATGQLPTYQIFGSNSITTDLVAVAPAGVVAAISPEPDIELATATALHMEDTSPQPIVSTGGVVAAPVRSMFQTAAVALKMRWRVSWVLRDPRAVAWLTPTAW